MKSYIVLLLLHITIFTFTQETKKVIIISNKVGHSIDSTERIKYGLFPGYGEEFRSAQIFKNADGTYEIVVYLANNVQYKVALSNGDFKSLKRQINTAIIPPQKQEPQPAKKYQPEYPPPYTSEAYQLERNHKTFIILTEKKQEGDTLTPEEENWLNQYNAYLDEYYTYMPEEEKEKHADLEDKEPEKIEIPVQDERIDITQQPEPEEVDQSVYIKHVLYSGGWYGLQYGIAVDFIFDIDGGPAVGIPLISAGGSMLLASGKRHMLNENAMLLSGHGKLVGWAHGYSTGLLLFGDELFSNEDYSKITYALGVGTSIGLGKLGFDMAIRNKNDWSGGRVALYRHYGLLVPSSSAAIAFSTGAENAHLFGATILMSGAGSYFLSHKIANMTDYTRGDIIAMRGLTLLNLYFTTGVTADILERTGRSDKAFILIPTAGALTGTVASHFWLRNTYLTPSQGHRINYATVGGTLVSMGIVAFFEPQYATPFYVGGYIGGMISYTSLLMHYKKYGDTAYKEKKSQENDFSFNIMPQNYFLNKMITQQEIKINTSEPLILPLFTFSKTF